MMYNIFYNPCRKVEWRIIPGLSPYRKTIQSMEERVGEILLGHAPECIWLLEHPPLYTSGGSASAADENRQQLKLPVYSTGRGGRVTYHGPGQRIIYVMLNLTERKKDIRAYVAILQEWIISSLAHYNIAATTDEHHVGVWINSPPQGPHRKEKIAALGIRLRQWVSFHGIAVNIAPDLRPFDDIIPCGIHDPRFGVTSLKALGANSNMAHFDKILREEFHRFFGPTECI